MKNLPRSSKIEEKFWKRTCLYFLGEYLMIAWLLFNEKDHSRSNLDRCFSPRLNIWVDLCVGTQWDQRWLQDNWWVPVLANAVIEPNLTSLLKLEAGILQMRTTSQTLESERKIPNFLELLLKMPSSPPLTKLNPRNAHQTRLYTKPIFCTS